MLVARVVASDVSNASSIQLSSPIATAGRRPPRGAWVLCGDFIGGNWRQCGKVSTSSNHVITESVLVVSALCTRGWAMQCPNDTR